MFARDPGAAISITNTDIVFDFLNGADPLSFFDSGAFNLDDFFDESDGSLFSRDFDLSTLLASDSFSTNQATPDIAGIDADGAVDLIESNAPNPVPEPASLALLTAALAGFGLTRWRSKGV